MLINDWGSFLGTCYGNNAEQTQICIGTVGLFLINLETFDMVQLLFPKNIKCYLTLNVYIVVNEYIYAFSCLVLRVYAK